MADRATRSGRVFNPYFLNNAIVVPNRCIRQLLMARALTIEDDLDSDDDNSHNGDVQPVSVNKQNPLDLPQFCSFAREPLTEAPTKGKRKREPDPPLPPMPRSTNNNIVVGTSTSHSSVSPAPPASAIIADAHASSSTDTSYIPSSPSPSSSPGTPTPELNKKARKVERKRERRRHEREQARGDAPTHLKAINHVRVRQSGPISVPIRFSHHIRPVASTGWMGLRDHVIEGATNCEPADGSATSESESFPPPEPRAYKLPEVLDPAMQMHYVDWNGCISVIPTTNDNYYVSYRIPGPMRSPRPKWKSEVADRAAELMGKAATDLYGSNFYGEYHGTRKHTKCKKDGSRGTPAANKGPPRRGTHRAATIGTGMGGGQEEPTPFFHTVLNRTILATLIAQKLFQRIAGFVNAWGWCSITALGDFDPNKGGHLILWDLRLAIRFPPGSTILIPSALLHHSNVAIQQVLQQQHIPKKCPQKLRPIVISLLELRTSTNMSELRDVMLNVLDGASKIRKNVKLEGLRTVLHVDRFGKPVRPAPTKNGGSKLPF
ncbi:hypothetical protein B0H17DRAFT_1151319 [Mycena rosella]|uniref:Uncharacterized protein n=1 Tax=Mycena rosella TaxID=1033263 RepID=A0AAD7BLI6_MYCRO|nr:hypothetical protein B0H17DRAFT_1151319 [Mycena rosella]